ncbi:hypothetical protein K443DRAFT_679702, partial [Laccaria amethystina LaAM-08-1]
MVKKKGNSLGLPFGAPNVRRRQEGASTSVVISVKLQKATILTAAGAHIHAVQNDRNWRERGR